MLVLAIPIFRFTGIIFIVALVIILYVLFKLWKSASGFSAKVNDFLKDIDATYDDFIRKRINLAYLEDKDLKAETSAIKSEALVILKPQISALIHHLQSGDNQELNISHKSTHFSGLPALLKSNTVREEQIYKSIEESIEASISARILDLKTGENLSF